MATSVTVNTTSGGFNPGTFTLDPADGLYVCGIQVIDGKVVSVNTRSTQNLFETQGALPSGFSPAASGVGTSGAYSSISFYDTLA
jgi:hypothetical protein